MPTSGSERSQPGWLACIHKSEGSRAKSQIICSALHQAGCFERILGIKVLSAWWGIRLQEITLLKNYVLCARHYVPPMLGIYNTQVGHAQLHKPVSTDERLSSARFTSAISGLTSAGDITLPSFSL